MTTETTNNTQATETTSRKARDNYGPYPDAESANQHKPTNDKW